MQAYIITGSQQGSIRSPVKCSLFIDHNRMKKIVSSCSLLLSIMMVMQNTVHAQWMRVNPVPYLGTIAFGIYNGKVIALTSDTTGMYISTDDGADWLPDSTGIKKSIQAIGVRGSYIFVAPYGVGVYRSTDGGVSWASANKGITNPYIYAFACTDSAIFAGAGNNGNSGGTIFRSTDSGATWVEVKNGLGGGGPSFTEMATKGDTVFAGSNVALYRTTNNGQSWKILNIGAIYTAVSPVFVHDTTIYVSKNLNDEVYRSTDNGDSWLEMGTGLPTATNSNGIYLTAYASNDTVVFSGIYGGGVYISVDHGMTWSSANFGLTDLSVYSLIISGNYLIAGTSNGIWRRALSDFITTDVK